MLWHWPHRNLMNAFYVDILEPHLHLSPLGVSVTFIWESPLSFLVLQILILSVFPFRCLQSVQNLRTMYTPSPSSQNKNLWRGWCPYTQDQPVVSNDRFTRGFWGEVGGGYCHICEGFSSSLVWDRLVYRYHRVMARKDDNFPGNWSIC